jgi:cytidine deaminase
MIEQKIATPVKLLSPADQELCRMAAEAATRAYPPYSKFAVGAAVRTRRQTYVGANLENASYGLAICAEVSALTRANSEGDFDVEAIAVVGHPEGAPAKGTATVTPCGRCRQLIYEAKQVSGVDIRVICCDGTASMCKDYSIDELLPDGFGPENLGIDVQPYRRARKD